MRSFIHLLFAVFLAICPLEAFAQTSSLPFQPGATISVSVSNSASAAAALPVGNYPTWQIAAQNTGSTLAFCKFGDSTVSAAVTDFPIPAGVVETLTTDRNNKYVSCITASSTTTVYFTGGIGQ